MSAPSVVYRAPPGRRARGSVRDDAPTSLDRSSSRSNERVARARSPAASSHGRARGRVVRRGEDSLEPRAGISAPRVRSSRRGGARLARGGSIRHVLFFRRVKSSREPRASCPLASPSRWRRRRRRSRATRRRRGTKSSRSRRRTNPATTTTCAPRPAAPRARRVDVRSSFHLSSSRRVNARRARPAPLLPLTAPLHRPSRVASRRVAGRAEDRAADDVGRRRRADGLAAHHDHVPDQQQFQFQFLGDDGDDDDDFNPAAAPEQREDMDRRDALRPRGPHRARRHDRRVVAARVVREQELSGDRRRVLYTGPHTTASPW